MTNHIQQAGQWLRNLPDWVPTPRISVAEDREIMFEWRRGNQYHVAVSFSEDGYEIAARYGDEFRPISEDAALAYIQEQFP